MSELIEEGKKLLKKAADFLEIGLVGEVHHSEPYNLPREGTSEAFTGHPIPQGWEGWKDRARMQQEREERSEYFGGEYSFQKGKFKPVKGRGFWNEYPR